MDSSELSHLANLPCLETLEIGDCVNWSAAADYEILEKLLHLRHLRIEQGPSVCILQHLETSLSRLSNLQHLEIINFKVDSPIEEFRLSNLKRLLIIPKYSSEVSHLHFLTFFLKLFHLLLTKTELIFFLIFCVDFSLDYATFVRLCHLNESFATVELGGYR